MASSDVFLSMPTFDPWTDARALAGHLRGTGAELMVVIGAEAWCKKCERLRTAFDALCAAATPPHVAWLWLDLEEHGDFLSVFVPPDLPLLLRWKGGQCIQAAVVNDIDPSVSPFDRVRLSPLAIESTRVRDPHQGEMVELPRLWTEFTAATWAKNRHRPHERWVACRRSSTV